MKVRYEVGDDVPMIETDWGKLKNVLSNILNNAIKFTDQGEVLDGKAARSYEGTGLRLTISKNLVELIGGKIEVESEVGKGSTFKVTIPVASS